MGKKGEITSQTDKKQQEMIDVIVDAMKDKKASAIVGLNFLELDSAICDHFIIANADSTTQVLAIADNVEDKMIEKLGIKRIRRSGNENALWIILDYGDIVVHVFQTEFRDFYKLEDLWADAIVTRYED